jgi:hypothetical protein
MSGDAIRELGWANDYYDSEVRRPCCSVRFPGVDFPVASRLVLGEGKKMAQAMMGRLLVAVALAAVSTTVFAEPVYLSCVYDSGAEWARGSPLTFVFDETRKEILVGNGSPASNVVVTPTEISFLHKGSLNRGSVPISIDRISGRFRTTVTSAGGEVPASGSCTLTNKTMF